MISTTTYSTINMPLGAMVYSYTSLCMAELNMPDALLSRAEFYFFYCKINLFPDSLRFGESSRSSHSEVRLYVRTSREACFFIFTCQCSTDSTSCRQSAKGVSSAAKPMHEISLVMTATSPPASTATSQSITHTLSRLTLCQFNCYVNISPVMRVLM